MQFLTVKRRSGEEIPINPSQVSYVRQSGGVTVIALAGGHEIRVAMPAGDVAKALEGAMGAEPDARKHVDQLVEPAPPADPMLPSAQQTPQPAEPADAPQAAEQGPSEEEQSELDERAHGRADEPGGGKKKG